MIKYYECYDDPLMYKEIPVLALVNSFKNKYEYYKEI